MVLNKCCCCLNLRTGAILIAIFQIVTGLIPLIGLVTWNTVVVAIICVVSGKCLLYGTLTNHLATIMMSLILSMIAVVFYIVAVITSIVIICGLDSNGPNFVEIAAKDIAFGIGMMLLSVVNLYFCICIFSFKNEVRNNVGENKL